MKKLYLTIVATFFTGALLYPAAALFPGGNGGEDGYHADDSDNGAVEEFLCAICYEELEGPYVGIALCGDARHMLCHKCAIRAAQQFNECPLCRQNLSRVAAQKVGFMPPPAPRMLDRAVSRSTPAGLIRIHNAFHRARAMIMAAPRFPHVAQAAAAPVVVQQAAVVVPAAHGPRRSRRLQGLAPENSGLPR